MSTFEENENYEAWNLQDYDLSNTTAKQIDHCLVAAKPFKNIDPNKPVRFTGKITSYMRSNGSYDYSIIVNKAREASKEELKCYISHTNM